MYQVLLNDPFDRYEICFPDTINNILRDALVVKASSIGLFEVVILWDKFFIIYFIHVKID